MREKIIKDGNTEIKISTSAYIVLLYSELFHKNIFQEMSEIIDLAAKEEPLYEKTDVIYRIAYTMAKHSDPDLPPMNEWLRSIDGVYTIPAMIPEIIDLWLEDTEQQSEAKKN